MATKDQIRAARKALNESQAAFATRFGVNQATVHRWETEGLPERGTARLMVEQVLETLRVSAQEAAE